MMVKSLISIAALLLASSNAAAIDARQNQCVSGNDAIDSLISSSAIMQALCASVVPAPTTRTVSITTSTQVTVFNTVTDTIMSPIGSTQTVFFTTTGTTTRTVRVTQTAQSGGSSPLPTAPSTVNPPPQPPVTSNPAPTSQVPPVTSSPAPPTPPAPTSSSGPPAPPAPAVPACDAVGYAGSIPSYHFDGSGTNGNFANCSGLCRADTQCASFGYGNGACLLFNVTDANNVNLVAGSPYRFFNRDCSAPIVSRNELGWNLIYGRQFGGGGTWGSSTGSIGSGGSVIQQLTDVCRCLFGGGSSNTITKTVVNAATITLRTRSTITIGQTVSATVTQTRRTLATVTAFTTVFVQPPAPPAPAGPASSSGPDAPPGGTFEGGVGI